MILKFSFQKDIVDALQQMAKSKARLSYTEYTKEMLQNRFQKAKKEKSDSGGEQEGIFLKTCLCTDLLPG